MKTAIIISVCVQIALFIIGINHLLNGEIQLGLFLTIVSGFCFILNIQTLNKIN